MHGFGWLPALTNCSLATYDETGPVDYLDVVQASSANYRDLVSMAGQYTFLISGLALMTLYTQVCVYLRDWLI